jgi:hypothetical protein
MFVVFTVVGLFHVFGGNLHFGWLWFLPALGFSWALGFGVSRFLSTPADRWLREKLATKSGPELESRTARAIKA